MPASGMGMWGLATACLLTVACERTDSRVDQGRARAQAQARAERAARYDQDDRTTEGWLPGGPSSAALPPGPEETLPGLLDQITYEVEAILEDGRTSQDLGAKIRDVLMNDPALGGDLHELEIDTAGHSVVLRGWVETEADRREAQARAQALARDGFVDNQLEVRGR